VNNFFPVHICFVGFAKGSMVTQKEDNSVCIQPSWYQGNLFYKIVLVKQVGIEHCHSTSKGNQIAEKGIGASYGYGLNRPTFVC
jgi:hypothetical protein